MLLRWPGPAVWETRFALRGNLRGIKDTAAGKHKEVATNVKSSHHSFVHRRQGTTDRGQDGDCRSRQAGCRRWPCRRGHYAGCQRCRRRCESRVSRPGPHCLPSSAPRKCWRRSTGIAENRDDDAAILSQENGKVRFEAWVDSLVLELRWKLALSHADEVNASKVLPPIPGAIPVQTTVAYQPLGVVTIIVPFNWPVAILGAALPHALLAGNTVIVKPPLTAPLATARIVQRIAEQLPPGVLNVVTGPDANMSALIRNPDVAKVCFTGSVNGGKKMMELASASLTRVTLELGGNDAAIVLKDAILDDVHLDRLFARHLRHHRPDLHERQAAVRAQVARR